VIKRGGLMLDLLPMPGQQFVQPRGLSNFRVLTVVPTRQRINTILAAHGQTPPGCALLFADRRGLLSAEDFFAYPWTDAAGQPYRLLD
jgi:hypothetical protein